MDKPLYVTKSFLPPIEEYAELLNKIWAGGQLTNQGPILKELEKELLDYLKVPHIQLVTNGTIALQFAIEALGIIGGEVITTPFSYVASTSSILWQKAVPVFVDIEPDNFTIDPGKIEEAITPKTKAILAVHVYGYPCKVEEIEEIAKKHNLKVIYDAAHAFGVKYKGVSLFEYGDISTCSFHSTKIFHTIEGGAVFTKDNEHERNIDLMKRFGHHGDEHIMLGINGKMSEFNVAMGLCVLKHIDKIIANRKSASFTYDTLLKGVVKIPQIPHDTEYNYSYYPVLFNTETELISAMKKLEQSNIHARRYFFPSLNKLTYLSNYKDCPASESISRRVLCLPLHGTIEEREVKKVCEVLCS